MINLPSFIAAMLFLSLAFEAPATERVSVENYGGRSMIVYVPSRLPSQRARALVIVLHGGTGNAQRIEAA
jgi:poly(3-hydroxybutyrate) depolymerase